MPIVTVTVGADAVIAPTATPLDELAVGVGKVKFVSIVNETVDDDAVIAPTATPLEELADGVGIV